MILLLLAALLLSLPSVSAHECSIILMLRKSTTVACGNGGVSMAAAELFANRFGREVSSTAHVRAELDGGALLDVEVLSETPSADECETLRVRVAEALLDETRVEAGVRPVCVELHAEASVLRWLGASAADLSAGAGAELVLQHMASSEGGLLHFYGDGDRALLIPTVLHQTDNTTTAEPESCNLPQCKTATIVSTVVVCVLRFAWSCCFQTWRQFVLSTGSVATGTIETGIAAVFNSFGLVIGLIPVFVGIAYCS